MTTQQLAKTALSAVAKTKPHGDPRNDGPDATTTYAGFLACARRHGSRIDVRAFLARLSDGELSVLQKAHSFIEAIDVAALSDEGAGNLIRQFDALIDLDSDGSSDSAAAWKFPPRAAPSDVKAAWQEATEGLSDGERSLKTAPFMAKAVGANIRFDGAGNPVGVAAPGDADYRDIFAEPGFSYADMARGLLHDLGRFKYTLSAADYGERRAFLETFLTRPSTGAVGARPRSCPPSGTRSSSSAPR